MLPLELSVGSDEVLAEERASRLDGTGIEADMIKQIPSGRFRGGLELSQQDVLAETVLAHRLRTLPLPDVTSHHQPVSVLTAGILGQQLDSGGHAHGVVPALEVVVGQTGQQIEIQDAQPLSFYDCLCAVRSIEIALVPPYCALKGDRGCLRFSRTDLPFRGFQYRLETRHIHFHSRLEVEPIAVFIAQHWSGASEKPPKPPVETVEKAVQGLASQRIRAAGPEALEQGPSRQPEAPAKREGVEQPLGLPPRPERHVLAALQEPELTQEADEKRGAITRHSACAAIDRVHPVPHGPAYASERQETTGSALRQLPCSGVKQYSCRRALFCGTAR